MQIICFVIGIIVKKPGKEMSGFVSGGSYNRIIRCSKLSKAIRKNAKYSAGKLIRFTTDGNNIEVSVKYRKKALLKNMDDCAVSNIDVFMVVGEQYKYCGNVGPTGKLNMIAHGRLHLDSNAKTKEIVFFLPAYSWIYEIRVNSTKDIGPVKKNRKLLAVYGSSISQGCAASSVCKSYVSLVALENDLDIINMAFSEGANGEEEIIENFASCEADYYVIEYDHNASVERLEKTHRLVYEKVRDKNPSSIIIIMTRISGSISIGDDESNKRERIIETTYNYGIANEDCNLFLIDLYKLSRQEKNELLKDDRHPNDIGMQYIADRINEILKKVNET